jgi:hypothetical protein
LDVTGNNLRKQDKDERDEHESLLDLYLFRFKTGEDRVNLWELLFCESGNEFSLLTVIPPSAAVTVAHDVGDGLAISVHAC